MANCFMYSQEFIKEHKEINAKIGRDFQCGKVSAGHAMKDYCEMIPEENVKSFCSRYPDAVIVAKGNTNMFSFIKPTTPFIGSGRE